VENEASNFVTSFAAIVANLVTGQDPHGAPYDAEAGDSGGLIPHVSAGTMAVAKDKAEGVNRPAEDKTKTPMEETVSCHSAETPIPPWLMLMLLPDLVLHNTDAAQDDHDVQCLGAFRKVSSCLHPC
jgi:hypothetical protein